MQYQITDLSVQEISIIAAGLGKLPLQDSMDVFLKIKGQCTAQDAAALVTPPTTTGGTTE